MKRGIIALGCLLIFASGWAFGQGTSRRLDGSFWKILNSSTTLGRGMKAMYVMGFINGYTRGMEDAALAVVGQAKVTTAERNQAKADLVGLRPLLGRPYSPVQVTSEMDSFYGDYRNAPVCWDDALVFSLGALSGHPPSEQELSAARVEGAKGKCAMWKPPSTTK